MLQGLDYVIASACEHNIRLVLTLTNYLADYGGMQIWVQWFKGKSISAFFTNPNITCAVHLFHHLTTSSRLAHFPCPYIYGLPRRTGHNSCDILENISSIPEP